MLDAGDEDVRGALTRRIAELGHAPAIEELAALLRRTPADVAAALRRLHDAHALLLHPNSVRPWVVHPFALAPGSCWVRTPQRGYWANCLYCAFGIVAALDTDAVVTTRLGGEDETVEFRVAAGALTPSDLIFHLSTPPARWWDNVIFACASFQPFRSEADVDRWCTDHALPKGAILTLPQLWRFAGDWYGNYVRAPWQKRSVAQVQSLFAQHGLTGPFWQVE